MLGPGVSGSGRWPLRCSSSPGAAFWLPWMFGGERWQPEMQAGKSYAAESHLRYEVSLIPLSTIFSRPASMKGALSIL